MLTSNWLALINIILMLDIIVAFICLSVGIFIPVKSSDYFVESAEKIGKYIGLPNFVLGAILVGIGTSLPELSSSLVAAINKHTEIIVGNVIGSNIFNILGVIGIPGIIGTITVPNLSWYFFKSLCFRWYESWLWDSAARYY